MAAGCFSVLGNNPFDVVKTQMQGKNASQYKNTWDCFTKLVKEDGFSALYRGVGTYCIIPSFFINHNHHYIVT